MDVLSRGVGFSTCWQFSGQGNRYLKTVIDLKARVHRLDSVIISVRWSLGRSEKIMTRVECRSNSLATLARNL